MLSQPCFHFGVLMRGVIVDDQVQIEFSWRLRVDLAQEIKYELRRSCWLRYRT